MHFILGHINSREKKIPENCAPTNAEMGSREVWKLFIKKSRGKTMALKKYSGGWHDKPKYNENENNLNLHRKSYGRYGRATEAESRPYADVTAG